MKLKSYLFILFFSLSTSVFSLETPKGGKYDKRVKFVEYKAAEVVKLVGHYGYTTHIKLGVGEKVKKIALGDSAAWSVEEIESNLFIKPVAEDAHTNMVILTNKRAYNFELSAHWSRNRSHPIPNDMYFQVTYNYPKETKKQKKKISTEKKVKENLDKKNDFHINKNYWVQGTDQIKPSIAFDDGRFTYLTFTNNKEMPSVFVENGNGDESLVNTSVNGDTIIVHKVASTIVLRKGKSVAAVFNKSYGFEGLSNKNGTTSPTVIRKIKGAE